MCGICGIIGDTEGKEKVIAGMMKAMEHRGPDGRNTYRADGVMFGFRRLSIIDPDKGMQPMCNEDGSMAMVFNGEIYNYQILREMLRQKGHSFRSDSDSEVLIHGYEEYQRGILEKLRGMFSFAIWDDKRKSLFAARDFFGIKPFYYAAVDGTLVFASEIKSILEYPGYHKEMNEEALEQYLSFQYSVLPETFFKGIYRLLPGHYLIWENGKIKTVQYFKPSLSPWEEGGQPQLTEDVEMAVCQSVRRHMVSDVEVGSFLSGGVDSGLITALSGCRRTFTVGFKDEEKLCDEVSCAQDLAEELDVRNHSRYIGRDEFREVLPAVMYHLDEPCADASAVAMYFLAQEAAKEVKVVLSGEGADEVFGGYNIYLEPKALKFLDWLPYGIRRRLASAAGRLPGHMKGRNYLIRASQPLKERYIGNAYIFHADERRQLLRKSHAPAPEQLLEEVYDGMRGMPDSDQMQSLDLMYWLPGDILQKADKMSMAHSLELRVPFLDRDLFQVARRIPHAWKTKNYTTKYILREAAKRHLPKEISQKKKLGFPVPIRNWIKEEDWYHQIREEFTGKTASAYFHTDYLKGLLDGHKSGREDNSRKIWTVYSFLVWHKVFFE